MTLYNLIDNNDGDSLGYFKSKLTPKQIEKVEKIANIIYGNTSSWDKTTIFEKLIKNGSLDMFEDEFEDLDDNDVKNILKNSKVILMRWYEKKKFSKMVKGYRIKSPYKDKSFILIKLIEVEF